jgi:hypothetical protein
MAGYEISLADFRRLVSDPYCQPSIAPLLAEWFGCRIEGEGPTAFVRDGHGAVSDLTALHAAIQADPERQNRIYNAAMTLWR